MDKAKPENSPVIQYAAVHKFCFCVNSNVKRFRHFRFTKSKPRGYSKLNRSSLKFITQKQIE